MRKPVSVVIVIWRTSEVQVSGRSDRSDPGTWLRITLDCLASRASATDASGLGPSPADLLGRLLRIVRKCYAGDLLGPGLARTSELLLHALYHDAVPRHAMLGVMWCSPPWW